MSALFSFIPVWILFATACISPGANTIIVMSTALQSGRFFALLVTLGLAVGGFIWAFVALLGIKQLLIAVPGLHRIISVIGSFYLYYLSFKLIQTLKNTSIYMAQRKMEQNISIKSALCKGLFTTLSNPKVATLWLSLAPMVSIRQNNPGMIFLFSSVIGGIVFVIYGTIGVVFSGSHLQQLYLTKVKIFNTLFAVALFIIATMLLLKFGFQLSQSG